MAAGRLGRVMRPLLGREVYECLTLDWPGGQKAAASPSDSDVQIRAVDRTQLGRLSADRACGISQKFLRGIERTPDLCFGAFAGEALVSYVFLAPASPIAIDARLQFEFPANWIYVYKAFTRPAWRGKRLLHQVLAHGMGCLGPHRGLAGAVTPMAADRAGSTGVLSYDPKRSCSPPSPSRAAFTI